jgi:hypothetical protein
MASSRIYARNTGAAIAGTKQVGNLAIGKPNAPFDTTGLVYWMGPDEDPGYIISYEDPIGRPGANGETGNVGFRRSVGKTDQAFLDLVNYTSGQTFTDTYAALNWLTSNGYHTSYESLISGTPLAIGYYRAFIDENFAYADGQMSFYDYSAGYDGFGTLDPNHIGEAGYAFYIYYRDLNGLYDVPLNTIVGSSGTMKLSQGDNFALYTFTDTAFSQPAGGGNTTAWNNALYGSPLNAFTLLQPASQDFLPNVDIKLELFVD